MVGERLKALVQMCCMWRRRTAEMTLGLSEVLRGIKEWEDIWEEILSQA